MLNQEMFDHYTETRNLEDRNLIVEKYLYMVDILIRKYLNKGVDYDDLYQVGAMALVSAVERFDISKGYEFTSFATPTILGEIKKYFRDKEWTVKVPRRLKEIAVKLPRAGEELFAKLERTPTVAELAAHLNVSEENILEALEGSKAYDAFSLSTTFDDTGEDGESPILEKYTGFEEKGYASFEYNEIIKKVLKKFSDMERFVFTKRFLENKTQTEIAKALNVSQMTISRAERNIKKKFAEELNR